MKKISFLACTALLASLVALTGCKKEGQNEPNKVVPKVTTDIAISLPTQVGGVNKMPGRTVQSGIENGSLVDVATQFAANGMNSIVLIPFAEKAKATSASKRHGANIDLGNFSGDVGVGGNRGKVYADKQVPMGTGSFLFYGVSGKTSSDLFEVGSLAAGTLTGEPSSFEFSLQPCCTNASEVLTKAGKFNTYLTGIANAHDTLYGEAAWKNITALQNEGYYNMFVAYSQLTTLSTYGVERMLTDLYHTLDISTDSLAKAIRKAILDDTYATLDGTGASAKVKLVSELQNFPQVYNIPVGAVSTAYTEGAFGGSGAHAYGALDPADLQRYVYPAQLWYFSNTKIRTANTKKLEALASKPNWKSVIDSYGLADGSVTSTTKSIALIDTIQYAVARLDVQVKFKTGIIKGNDPADPLTAESDHGIDVAFPGVGYPMKAVLVGGQRNVGFDFTPLDGSAVYTIYDTVMDPAINAVQNASVYSAANSTLVLETKTDDGAHGCDVNVALEFINTGDDFYGVNNQLIPTGARFYIVGTLEAVNATEEGLEHKVFKQDYTTTARFNINSLKKAYSTIPDLKAPQLEIGMSVDLTWQAGHTYDISIQ